MKMKIVMLPFIFCQDMLEKQPGSNVPATPPHQQETPNQQVINMYYTVCFLCKSVSNLF